MPHPNVERLQYQNKVSKQERENQIRCRAYVLWQKAGQPEGHADAFWMLAEAEWETAAQRHHVVVT